MESATARPATGVADLQPQWCTHALSSGVLGGGRVVAVEAAPIGNGLVADTFRLSLTYEPAGAGPPTVVAKVPAANETSRTAARLTRTYEIESSFYRDLAPTLPVRAPQCYDAAYDPDTGDYHVVLEDAAPAVQGDQLAGCSLAEIEAAVDQLVLLHGPRWGDQTLLERAWLHRAQPERIDETAALVDMLVPVFMQRFAERLEPSTVSLIGRLTPRLRAHLHDRPGPWTVVHGDFRADNLLFSASEVVVVDWQTVAVGPGPADLAYLLGASLLPADRRQHEAALVDRYTAGLREHGVDVDDEAVWTGYRRHAFASLIMGIAASALVQQTERGDEMFIAMVERPAVQIADLDAEALLPA